MALLTMCAIASGDVQLPPKELRAEWSDLKELKFTEWTIKSFNGWDVPFDGGSKVCFFESASGEKFDIMAANLAYWTDAEKKAGKQVFFVIHKNRYYRIEPNSDQERNVIEKLETAKSTLSGEGNKDPRLLAGLIDRLRSRDPMFNPKR
jgi:hypothetical protein